MKALILSLLTLPLVAVEPGQLLRDGLYAEEVERNPEAAAAHYREIVELYDDQRPLAASAMFRLAEIRLASGDTEPATALYQRLLREFPETAAEVGHARLRLTELGAELPAGGQPDDAGQRELLRLRELAESAPEMLRDADTLERAAAEGWTEVVRFLLEHGADPNQGQALVRAAEAANLAICRILVGHSDPSPGLAGAALASAIEKDRVGLLQALLELGLPANSPPWEGSRETLLHSAVGRSSEEAVRLLVEHEADLAAFTPHIRRADRDFGPGTPLHLAALNQNAPAARLLIELDAPVDAAAPESDFTPLVAAAIGHDAELLRLLLEHGADPNQPEALRALVSEPGPPGHEAAEVLLEAGCDPNAEAGGALPLARVFSWQLQDIRNANEQSRRHQEQVELIKLLLRHGADPNTSSGTYRRPAVSANDRNVASIAGRSPFLPRDREEEEIPRTPLLRVVELKETQRMINVSLIGTLLDAGAIPGEAFPEIFQFVADYADEEDELELVERLIQLRPKEFHPEVSGYARSWDGPVKRLFLERVLEPELRSRGGVQAVLTEDFGSRELVPAGEEPPALHELLLRELAWISASIVNGSDPPTVTLVRQEPSGEIRRTAIDFAGEDDLPELRSGDLLEISGVASGSVIPRIGLNASVSRRFAWQLRRHLEIPITLEIGERSRPLTLRGDCLVFDPTRDVAPILPAGLLAARAWNLGYQLGASPRPELRVVRDGWGEIPIDWGDDSLELQAGDLLRILPPENLDELRRSYRPHQIGLRIPDHDHGRDLLTGPSGADPVVKPTLVAFLADCLADAFPRQAEGSPDLAQLATTNIHSIPTVLPHPDFSAIRIRRLEDDGSESVLEVDLAAAIAACTDDTPPEKARAADVPLRPGDLVELPLLAKDEPYRGFSEDQARFFAKVLSGKLQVFPKSEAPQLHTLRWQPTAWLETEVGWLPFNPTDGTASTRLRQDSELRNRLVGNSDPVEIERAGKRFPGHAPGELFLRDGDRLYPSSALRPRVQQPARPPRSSIRPRPRAIVPPSR